MRDLFRIIPIVLYMSVGAISLVMAIKNFSAKRLLPFHEQAMGKSWTE